MLTMIFVVNASDTVTKNITLGKVIRRLHTAISCVSKCFEVLYNFRLLRWALYRSVNILVITDARFTLFCKICTCTNIFVSNYTLLLIQCRITSYNVTNCFSFMLREQFPTWQTQTDTIKQVSYACYRLGEK